MAGNVGNVHPMDELAALLEKAKVTQPGRRPYQDVLFDVKNTEKALNYQVSFPHKSPSQELKEQAQADAEGAAPAAAAPIAPAEKVEASMTTYRTAGVEVMIPDNLAAMAAGKAVTVIVPEAMTVEAKKNTKTVPEDKFKSCKEQVKEKSPGVNEYAVCTDSLGGQPASYHKKKKSSADGKVAVASASKEAVTALRKAYPDEFLKQMGIVE